MGHEEQTTVRSAVGEVEATGPAGADKQPPRTGASGWPIAILNAAFDHLTVDEALARIEAMIRSRRPHHLVTPNVDFLVQAQRDAELRRILLNADLVLCDGTPLLWVSRLLGNALPERVAGADLTPQLIRVAAAKSYRLFFLGGMPGVAAQTVARLKAEYPGLEVTGYSPPVCELLAMDHAEISRRIRAARPDILLVCFGCPKAEKWSAMHYRSLGVPVVIGVGAVIDFLAGRIPRAPKWMQRAGVEWVFRLLLEPRRLYRRYLTDLRVFLPAVLAQWWHLQARSSRNGAAMAFRRTSNVGRECQILVAPECFDIHSIRQHPSLWMPVPKQHWLVKLDRVRFVDSTAIGLLIQLQRQLRKMERRLLLVAPSPVICRTLRRMRLADHFRMVADLAAARELLDAHRVEPPPVFVNGEPQLLYWRGEITAENVDEVRERTRSLVATLGRQYSELIIDFSGVRFIDSAGIALMAATRRHAQQHGAGLRFIDARPEVREAVRRAKVDDTLLASDL